MTLRLLLLTGAQGQYNLVTLILKVPAPYPTYKLLSRLSSLFHIMLCSSEIYKTALMLSSPVVPTMKNCIFPISNKHK